MATGSLYAVAIAAQAQTAAKTLIELTAAATTVLSLERAYISQSTFDTSESLSAKIQRVTTTGTGTAFTIAKMSNLAGTVASSAKTNMTAEPTYTANTILINQGFSALAGWLWTPASDDEVITVPPSGLLGIMLNTAPSASMSFDYGCVFREYG